VSDTSPCGRRLGAGLSSEDVPVLIAGGSLVGLSTALFLGGHGVPSLVVERHPGTAIHPRAALVNQRTIELYRSMGLEAQIIEASDREFVQNGAIMSVESLGGREVDWYFRNINEGVEDLSPSPRLFVTQIGLEPVLRTRAEALGARLEYGTELVSFEADDDCVTAVVKSRADDRERTVRARYLVAADGSHSPVRRRLGIPLQGHGTFSNSITIYFRADVRPLIGERNLSVIYVFGPRLQGFFRFSKAGDAGFLVVNAAIDGDGHRSTDLWADTSDKRCVDYVREALGASDIPVEIENVQRWNACAEWAAQLQDGRVFIVGDAAHNMPPTGGFGGNTGVQDGHNLAWKLALVLSGVAGDGLLATYDAERRAVAEMTVEQAYTRYVLRLAPELGKENLQAIVPEATVELGYRYSSSAVVVEDDGDGAMVENALVENALVENPAEPSARPGTRAPHLVVASDSEPISLLDVMGHGFVLFAGGEGASWCDAAPAVAATLGLTLDAYAVGSRGALVDEQGLFEELYGVGPAGASLIRPDGFVAWRTRSAGDDAEAVLHAVLSRILAR
jgi:2-polyprenyl-6-methoxyphenol hydroxylase-like FAD-dependent oxidoreductase